MLTQQLAACIAEAMPNAHVMCDDESVAIKFNGHVGVYLKVLTEGAVDVGELYFARDFYAPLAAHTALVVSQFIHTRVNKEFVFTADEVAVS